MSRCELFDQFKSAILQINDELNQLVTTSGSLEELMIAHSNHTINFVKNTSKTEAAEVMMLIEEKLWSHNGFNNIQVLLGSMGALTIKTIVSIALGRIFQSVPAQIQMTLPIGEYAAVTLLLFFGLQSIRDAWKLPPAAKTDHRGSHKSNEPPEEISVKLSPIEVLGESFSLVFFAEWGDRSMLATMALGAAQSPLGVASGAIAGHLLATIIAVLGGSFLSHYISEKLSGYICGALFLVFAVATFFGVF